MKHKKFVKQLMSMGYDRNNAEDTARACASMGASYEQCMKWVKIGYRSRIYLNETAAGMAKIVQTAVEAMAEIFRKFTEAVSAIDWYAAGEAAGNLLEEMDAIADSERDGHREDILDALSYSTVLASDTCHPIGGGWHE